MIERFKDDLALQLPVKRHAEVVPHHERHEDRPRRLGVLGDIERDGDRDGRDIPVFDSALNQRD